MSHRICLPGRGDTLPDLFDLTAGTYRVSIVDQQGCTATDSIEIIDPAPISLSAITTDAQCANTSDGRIEIAANGGNGTYLLRRDGQTQSQRGELSPGRYSFELTDENQCRLDTAFDIGSPPRFR